MNSQDPIRTRLLQILRQNSLKLGNFTLASGQASHYYFDSKFTTLNPEGAYLTARLILEALAEASIQADAIGGLTLGADPIVAAVAAVSHMERDSYPPLPAFIVRKRTKGHGTRRRLEGIQPEPGTRVVIIDDVCTTGGSTLEAVTGAEEAGCEVVAVLALVDREQGGAHTLRNYRFIALISAADLLDDPEIQARLSELQKQAPRARCRDPIGRN